MSGPTVEKGPRPVEHVVIGQTVSDVADSVDDGSNLSIESERVSNVALTPFASKRFTLLTHRYL